MINKVKSTYDEAYAEYINKNNSYKKIVNKIDNKHKEIFEYIRSYDIVKFNELKIGNNKSLSELLKEKTPKFEYSNYIISYFETLIASRNYMISKKKPIMIYSYLYNLTMYLELVLKYAVVTNNEHFISSRAEQYWTNHDIKKMLEENKNNFLSLGLNEECYDLLLSEINTLKTMSKIHDIGQSFKYPIAKDFNTGIISEELLNLDFQAIKALVERHKEVLFIGLIIFYLISTDNINWLCNNVLIQSYSELEDSYNEIKKEINSKKTNLKEDI